MTYAKLQYMDESLEVDLEEASAGEIAKHDITLGYVLGLAENQKRGAWRSPIISDKIQLLQLVSEIIDYLDSESVAYALDSNLEALIHEVDEARIHFDGIRDERKPAPTNALNRLPEEFIRVLKDHQVQSLGKLLAAENGANFSVPGSGKTAVALASYAIWKSEHQVEKLIVVGPTSSFMVWEEEFSLCFNRPPAVVRLRGASRQFFYDHASEYELFLISYRGVASDLELLKKLCQVNRAMLVLDESHHAKRFRSGLVAEAVLELAPYSKRRMVLTGTPMPQSTADLWTQMSFLWPQGFLLGSREDYEVKYVLSEDVARVRETIVPFFVRIKKSQLGLPPQHISIERLPLGRYQQDIYDALARQFLADLPLAPEDRAQLREWRRGRIIRLLQAASNPELLNKRAREFRVPPLEPGDISVVELVKSYTTYETPPKFLRVQELADRIISEGDKVVIWTSFIYNLAALKSLLKAHKPLILFGGIPSDPDEDSVETREGIVRLFRNDPDRKILIAIPASCGESLSLHRVCHNAIYLDRTFKAAEFLQSCDRIHRIGLGAEEDVYYHLLLSEHTIDDVVNRRLEIKLERMEQLFESDLPVLSLETAERREDRISFSGSHDEEEEDFAETVKSIDAQYS